jgi:bifunctional UDP-N-acetylglucosamine pyrophosphorylase / glucosamine-1-phosphate N-acetyltransferase
MNIVILAAGMGKRMRSALPKVMHTIAGKALLSHVIDTALSLNPARLIVIYGHGGELVRERIGERASGLGADGQPFNAPIFWAKQDPQLGTGHALMQALPHLDDAYPTLVLYGDVPLTKSDSLKRLVEAAGPTGMGLLTVVLPNPTGYGRIIRQAGKIQRIVEQKDAKPDELAVNEINTGIMVGPTKNFRTWLSGLSNNNAQKEYYLTDVIGMAVADGFEVQGVQPSFAWEADGVNSKVQLAELERVYQKVRAEALLEQGVMLLDPARFDVRGSLSCGSDVVIDVNCVFEGQVSLGDGVEIGANCVIKNATIGAGTVVAPFTHIDGAVIGHEARIGPFARLRPGTALGNETHIGNFVEIKNTQMDEHSKANHLAYVGDSIVGKRVNIGAGTITCNYDGANKHQTIIEDDVHIGSDSQLVAPVRVGKGATLGAGTTLRKDAPAGKLTLTGVKQVTIDSWKRPVKVAKKTA